MPALKGRISPTVCRARCLQSDPVRYLQKVFASGGLRGGDYRKSLGIQVRDSQLGEPDQLSFNLLPTLKSPNHGGIIGKYPARPLKISAGDLSGKQGLRILDLKGIENDGRHN